MAFKTGFSAVQESVKRAQDRNASGGTGGAKYKHPIDGMWTANWKDDGELKVVRFLSNNFVTFPMHRFVTTKDGRHKDFACSGDTNPDLSSIENPRPCYICENVTREVLDTKTGEKKSIPSKPTEQIFGVVVEREYDDDGNVSDVMWEMDLLKDPNKPDGETQKVEVPKISLMVMSMATSDLINGFYVKFKKTSVDRDYDITRRGTGTKTSYQPIPNDPDPEYKTQEQLWDLYGLTSEDGQDPVQTAIIKWIERRATPEYYGRYLNTSSPADSSSESREAPADKSAPSATPKGTGFAGLRSSLKDAVAKQYPESN